MRYSLLVARSSLRLGALFRHCEPGDLSCTSRFADRRGQGDRRLPHARRRNGYAEAAISGRAVLRRRSRGTVGQEQHPAWHVAVAAATEYERCLRSDEDRASPPRLQRLKMLAQQHPDSLTARRHNISPTSSRLNRTHPPRRCIKHTSCNCSISSVPAVSREPSSGGEPKANMSLCTRSGDRACIGMMAS